MQSFKISLLDTVRKISSEWKIGKRTSQAEHGLIDAGRVDKSFRYLMSCFGELFLVSILCKKGASDYLLCSKSVNPEGQRKHGHGAVVHRHH
jgi:hypothetical protein